MHNLVSLVSVLFWTLQAVHGSPILSFSNSLLNSRQESLQSCLSSHGVPTYLNSSANWGSLVTPYNLALAYTPAALTLPTTPQHVSDAVVCAAAAGVKVQAKSGGHSYASYSTGGQDGSLIVDLQWFNSVSLNNSTGIAIVGGGVRLGNLAEAIYQQGQRALTHGTCPGVGIGGHFTHGGFGYASRIWGLALDTIVAMDVVLANGSYIHATPVYYRDVYYALRGAADSFGIVTQFHLQTLPAPSEVVTFSASIPAALTSAATAADSFFKLQTFVTRSPYMSRNINLGLYTDGSGFSISGWYFGNKDFFAQTILPAILEGLPAPASTSVESKAWLDALQLAAGSQTLAQPLSGYNSHDTFYAKSITTRDSIPLTLNALQSFFSYMLSEGTSSAHPWFTIFNLYGGIDSQINSRSSDWSAYSDRDSLWVIQNYGFTDNSQPPYSPEITTFIDGLQDSLVRAQPDGNFGAYLNYVDPDLTATQAAMLYYGKELYNKLATLKKSIDPDFVFWNPQAIGNADLSGKSTTTAARL